MSVDYEFMIAVQGHCIGKSLCILIDLSRVAVPKSGITCLYASLSGEPVLAFDAYV